MALIIAFLIYLLYSFDSFMHIKNFNQHHNPFLFHPHTSY